MKKKRGLPEKAKPFMFKPGVSGNPEGARAHNPELKKLKALTTEEMVEIGSLVIKGSIDELKALKTDPNASVLKAMMASVAIKTIATGNAQALDILLNRLVGKPKESVTITSENQNMNLNVNASIDEEKMRNVWNKLKDEV